MNIYSKQNYSNYSNYANEAAIDLSTELGNFTLSLGGKTGRVVSCRVPEYTNDLIMKVEYPDKTTEISYKVITERKLAYTFEEGYKEKLDSCFEIITTSYNNLQKELQEIRLAEQEELKKQREEEAKAKRLEMSKLKAEKKRKAALAKLEQLKPENISNLFDSPMTEYEVIGWLARHTKNIKATMPDYMEPWFIKNFGTDTERYVVDSEKKTSGGYDMQWGLGINIILDTPVSGVLERRATSKNKRSINSVEFAWDLVDNYGFSFSKEQDLEKIMDEVPMQYIEDFKRGYAM